VSKIDISIMEKNVSEKRPLFLLSLKNAKIYNLDEVPVTVEKWYELENVKLMYELFKENKEYFEW